MASISVSLDRNADRHDVKLLKRELDTLPGVTPGGLEETPPPPPP